MKKNKSEVVVTFRIKCDSRKEAEDVCGLYDCDITDFAFKVGAQEVEIYISDGIISLNNGEQNGTSL